MNRILCCIVFLLTLVPAALAGDLNADIRAAIHDKLLAKGQVGVRVVKLGDVPSETRVIYEHNATVPLIPASNLKLVSTAAALDLLGPDFRFRTLLAGKGEDLAIIGDGDPTLGDAELLRKVGWDTLTVFNAWAKQLTERKITSARNLLVDDSIFDTTFQHPNWPADQDDRRYMAGVAGLNLNANCVDVVVSSNGHGAIVDYTMNPPTHYVQIKNTCVHGNDNAIILSRVGNTNQIVLGGETRGTTSVPVTCNVEDPALFTGTVLQETLIDGGIRFSGQVLRDRTIRQQLKDPNSGWTILAAHETALPTVLARANKDSMNVYAEALAKRIGAQLSGTGDWTSGPAAMGEFMKRIGVPEDQFHFDDGCGLSKQNAITATALTQVLIYNFHNARNRQIYFSSLSVAGVDGTLEDRFRGSDLRTRVFAKSGFVDGVSTLSGYLRAKDDQWYAFSILMNGIPPKSNSSIKPIQERIVMAVDRDAGR